LLQWIFGALMTLALVYGMITGNGNSTALSMLEGAADGVQSAIAMAGSFALFCGLMAIVREAGAVKWISGRIAPSMKKWMGKDMTEDAVEYAALNLTANFLGLGNAATPMGVEAARRMKGEGETAGNALCLFLVINASSVQLMPTTVIALRAAAGSASPGSIWLPSLIATGISTLVGIASCKTAEKLT